MNYRVCIRFLYSTNRCDSASDKLMLFENVKRIGYIIKKTSVH